MDRAELGEESLASPKKIFVLKLSINEKFNILSVCGDTMGNMPSDSTGFL
jgi:hypothetical protein